MEKQLQLIQQSTSLGLTNTRYSCGTLKYTAAWLLQQGKLSDEGFFTQAQLVVLSAQIAWSENVESALNGGGGDNSPLQSVLANVEVTLNVLADSVLMEQPPLRRRKLEHLVSKNLLSSLGFTGEHF